MKTLFVLELKKLAKKRMNIIVIAVCLLLIGVLFYLPVSQYIVLDTDGNQVNGLSAIAMEKEYANTYAGKLTDEKIKTDIAAYQALFDDPANVSKDTEQKALTDSAYYKYFFPYSDYWKLINGNYVAPSTYDSTFSAITNMDLENGIDFYAARDEKINTLLNQEYVDWNFSNSEKAFWLDRVSSITTPYEYSYHAGWEMLLSCLELFVIGIIGICICVSGTFCGEYKSGADSIILSSRYGKSKLITAKILAAFVYSLPVQVLDTITPYNLSLMGATLLGVATLYLILIGMVAFTLLLSAKLKSSVPVLALIVLAIMLPMFLGVSETNGIWNRILALLPYNATQTVFSDEFFGYFDYPFGKVIFDVVIMRMIVYTIIALICIPFVRREWKRHQVS